MSKLSQLLRLVTIRAMSTTPKPAWCDKLPRPQYASLERIPLRSETWFQVYKIHPNVFALYEPYHWEETISYLVIGTKQSLLIDTGMGIGNIQQVIDTLIPTQQRTSLQIINTHTHHDHIGDNWRFSGSILGVRSPFASKNAQGSFEEAQDELQPGMIWEYYLPKDFDRHTYQIRPYEVNHYVQEGDRIDLGGDHQLEVIATPGHSPDSISLLDQKHRLLFAGDAFYQGPILLYRPETNLKDYVRSLQKLAKISDRVDLVLPGHNVPNVPSKLLIKAAKAMEQVMDGKVQGKISDPEQYLEYSFGEFSFVIAPSFLSNK